MIKSMHAKLIVLLVLAFAAVLSIALTASHHAAQTQKGVADIIVAVPDTAGLAATLNDQKLGLNGMSAHEELAPGTYDITVAKPGYTSFTTSFTITGGADVLIRIPLQRTVTPVLHSLSEVPAPQKVAGWNLMHVQYFDNNSWAFVNAQLADGTSAFFILHYDDISRQWALQQGPETIASPDSTTALPNDLQDYLKQNNYLSGDLQ